MEKTGIKNLFVFSVGAITGAFAMYVYSKKHYESYVSSEIAAYIEYQNAKESIEHAEKEASKNDIIEDSLDEYGAVVRTYSLKDTKKDIGSTMRDRGLVPMGDESDLFPTYEWPDEEEHPEEDEAFEEPIQDLDTTDKNIFVIDSSEYFESEEPYEKMTLTYYIADRTLCDERDIIIPNLQEIIGDTLQTPYTDENVVYVRNERISSDFEIIISNGSYVETVLGYLEVPKEKEKVQLHKLKDEPKEKKVTRSKTRKKVNADGEI